MLRDNWRKLFFESFSFSSRRDDGGWKISIVDLCDDFEVRREGKATANISLQMSTSREEQ